MTEGVGGARTLSGRVPVPATLEAVVTCKAVGYADAVRHVALTARRPCSTHLGTLATGTITHSGTIADDTNTNRQHESSNPPPPKSGTPRASTKLGVIHEAVCRTAWNAAFCG